MHIRRHGTKQGLPTLKSGESQYMGGWQTRHKEFFNSQTLQNETWYERWQIEIDQTDLSKRVKLHKITRLMMCPKDNITGRSSPGHLSEYCALKPVKTIELSPGASSRSGEKANSQDCFSTRDSSFCKTAWLPFHLEIYLSWRHSFVQNAIKANPFFSSFQKINNYIKQYNGENRLFSPALLAFSHH